MNIDRAVILSQSAALTPLGDLVSSVDSLIAGETALRQEPIFDIAVGHMPFKDKSNRDLFTCARNVLTQINTDSLNSSKHVLVYGAAKGDMRAIESNNPNDTLSPLLGDQAIAIARLMGLSPARIITVSNACASGAIAIEVAKELLDAGECEKAVVVGFDCISRFVVTGFNALSALSPTAARPFDADRDGLSLGEGMAVAILESREPGSGDILVSGTGSSNDANHRTGPSRTGEGLFNAARAAIKDAGKTPGDIGAVKCHGTATVYNDAMEAKAIYRMFGDECPPCCSIKGAIGHCSGAGSLIEVLVAAECLRRQILPPTAGYSTHGVDEPISVSSKSRTIAKNAVLCLSAGFGGVNAGIVIEEVR